MAAASFLSRYLSDPLPYVLSASLNKTFPSFFPSDSHLRCRAFSPWCADGACYLTAAKCQEPGVLNESGFFVTGIGLYPDDSSSSQGSTTCVSKAVVCAIMSVGWCI